MSAMPAVAAPQPAVTGGRLVDPSGRTLPFLGGHLAVDASGGLARVVLRQRFVNPYDEPLRVTYQVPLPADAAVGGYAFELAGERVTGVVEPRAKARQRFEEAIIAGRTAALLEQERSSLFRQEVGNLPPKGEVVCELQLDQLLSWEHGGWAWRFPTVVAPRFLGGQGRVPDADRVSVPVATTTTPRLTFALTVRDVVTGALTSPTHPLHVVGNEAGLKDEEGVALDRDVVVRWPVAAPKPGVQLDTTSHIGGCGLLTVVPPTSTDTELPRDLVILLDTSGSMGGRPLDQAKAVCEALIGTLSDHDQLQMIEFSTRPRSWTRKPVAMTASGKGQALSWLRGLSAGGGTQMKDGILAALDTLRPEAQRQVVLVTDGLIGFEREIVGAIRNKMPAGCRVHTLGVGSGVNRSLLGPAARAGGGIETIIGLDESPDSAAKALVAATASPVLVDFRVSGSALVEVAHHRAPDLMGGRPSRLALRLRPEGGSLQLSARSTHGTWEYGVNVPALVEGSASIARLVGRELVEEQEALAATGQSVDAEIERLGVLFQIATRKTSFVAVSSKQTVDPTAPGRTETVPQALPYGTSAEGLGLRPAAGLARAGGVVFAAQAVSRHHVRARMMAPPPAAAPGQPKSAGPSGIWKKAKAVIEDAFEGFGGGGAPPEEPESAAMIRDLDVDDLLGADMQDEEAAFEPEPVAEAPARRDDARKQEAERRRPRKGRRLRIVRLVARIVLAKDGRYVLELTLDRPLDWAPERLREVRCSDGRIATLVRDQSTKAGGYGSGQVLRFVLDLEGPPPTQVAFERGLRGDHTLVLDL